MFKFWKKAEAVVEMKVKPRVEAEPSVYASGVDERGAWIEVKSGTPYYRTPDGLSWELESKTGYVEIGNVGTPNRTWNLGGKLIAGVGASFRYRPVVGTVEGFGEGGARVQVEGGYRIVTMVIGKYSLEASRMEFLWHDEDGTPRTTGAILPQLDGLFKPVGEWGRS